MEKHDYVICSWCKTDIIPNFEYNIVYEVTHNEAVDRAKNLFLSHYGAQEFLTKLITEKLIDADGYEAILNDLMGFEVWEIDSNISKEAWDELDFYPDIFCKRYCQRVA